MNSLFQISGHQTQTSFFIKESSGLITYDIYIWKDYGLGKTFNYMLPRIFETMIDGIIKAR